MSSLKISKSSDVIPMIKAENELVSQSENAIASWGKRSGGKIIWFNAVAFNEQDSTAIRKYGFISNEKAHSWFNLLGQTLRFDAEAVVDPEVLDAPYANESAKKIAVLESLLDDFSEDFEELSSDSQTLKSASMMAKQVMKTLLTDLEQSPALAQNLDKPGGMDFDHLNYDEGKVRMLIRDDIVKFKAMTGKSIRNFEKKLDVKSM